MFDLDELGRWDAALKALDDEAAALIDQETAGPQPSAPAREDE